MSGPGCNDQPGVGKGTKGKGPRTKRKMKKRREQIAMERKAEKRMGFYG